MPDGSKPTSLEEVDSFSTAGTYTFKLTAKAPAETDEKNLCVKNEKLVEVVAVTNTVDYLYGGNTTFPAQFNAAAGSTFVPSAITATAGGKDVPFTLTVTKNGKAVDSYTEPGTYDYVLESEVSENSKGSYAGYETGSFTVVGKSYVGCKAYVSIDGKNVEGLATKLSYTGSELKPVVVVRDAKNGILAEGTDYSVKVLDSKEEAVESVVDAGTYKVVVEFVDDTSTTDIELSFKVSPAEIAEVRSTADFFALPADGTAATPSFIGSTKSGDDFDKGLKFELSADNSSVKYYASKVDGTNVVIDEKSPVKESDLTKAGAYFAKVNVLTTVKNFSGSNLEAKVVLKESVVFTDVDANEWYAKPVYEAKEQGYMNGLAGTKLFMPEANITRAELAGVLFNMAGQKATDKDNASFPTRFDDVDKDAWFAQSVSWASQTGVMNGYDADSFGPFDNASREQVACILYNYAKAQGKDVSVEDADAALAKYSDGEAVSSWAKTAVAWAVENGVMGNGSELNCFGTITRAEVAAMAVNFQPEKLPEAVL